MFNTSAFLTVLILLSATRIIFCIPVRNGYSGNSIPLLASPKFDDYSEELVSTSTITYIPADFTIELQNVSVCDTVDQWTECVTFLERHTNKDSIEYRIVQVFKRYSKLLQSFLLPPPILAVYMGFYEIIPLVLRIGLPVNKKYTSSEETMLHVAAEQGQDNLITLLLTERADIQVKKRDGDTPLHMAVSQFKSTTVKLLLDTGADVNVTNNKRETPFFKAVDYLCPENKEHGTQIKSKKYVIGKNIINMLLEHGADTNIANNLGRTPLHAAAKNCNMTIVKLLIDGGANINDTDANNQTPLHVATQYNNLHVVEYLVILHCVKTITDSDNKTALDIAKESNFTKIVDLLSI